METDLRVRGNVAVEPRGGVARAGFCYCGFMRPNALDWIRAAVTT
jgi:hypothetical protein